MILSFDQMGVGREWVESLLPLQVYLFIQFWAACIVMVVSCSQLHITKKFSWPPEPGRLTIFGGYLGLVARSAWLSLKLADFGIILDVAALIIGRCGIALQAIVSLFAIEDVMAGPTTPRPFITWMLVAVVMIQTRSLTANTPRLPPQLR